MKTYARSLGIPEIKGGSWFIDFKKEPNFSELSLKDQNSLTEQIDKMIRKKYKLPINNL